MVKFQKRPEILMKKKAQNTVIRSECSYLFFVMHDWNNKATLPSMFHYNKKGVKRRR